MRVHLGHATEVFRVSATTAGTYDSEFILDSGSLVAGLVIRSTSGTVTTPSQLTGYAFTQYASGVGCPTLYDTTATAFTATSVYNLRTISLPAGGSVREAFENLRIEAGETLIVTGQTSSSTTELVVSIDGFEDF